MNNTSSVRRFGKMSSAINNECNFVRYHANVRCLWVAPTYCQTAYDLMKQRLEDVIVRYSDKDLRLELINGSVIECFTKMPYIEYRKEEWIGDVFEQEYQAHFIENAAELRAGLSSVKWDGQE